MSERSTCNVVSLLRVACEVKRACYGQGSRNTSMIAEIHATSQKCTWIDKDGGECRMGCGSENLVDGLVVYVLC